MKTGLVAIGSAVKQSAVLLAAGYIISGRALTKWLLTVFADMAKTPMGDMSDTVPSRRMSR